MSRDLLALSVLDHASIATSHTNELKALTFERSFVAHSLHTTWQNQLASQRQELPL